MTSYAKKRIQDIAIHFKEKVFNLSRKLAFQSARHKDQHVWVSKNLGSLKTCAQQCRGWNGSIAFKKKLLKILAWK